MVDCMFHILGAGVAGLVIGALFTRFMFKKGHWGNGSPSPKG